MDRSRGLSHINGPRGLGPGSVSETVEQLDGRMQIESQEGVDTRIHLDLSLAAAGLQAEL